MKVNLWIKNSYRLWLTNWPKTSKPLKTSVSLSAAKKAQRWSHSQCRNYTHLGYEKNQSRQRINSPNGYSTKSVITGDGPLELRTRRSLRTTVSGPEGPLTRRYALTSGKPSLGPLWPRTEAQSWLKAAGMGKVLSISTGLHRALAVLPRYHMKQQSAVFHAAKRHQKILLSSWPFSFINEKKLHNVILLHQATTTLKNAVTFFYISDTLALTTYFMDTTLSNSSDSDQTVQAV